MTRLDINIYVSYICNTSTRGVGGVGRDNYKRCSCIEVCDTLWLFSSNKSRARCVGVGWGGWGGAG